MSTRNADRSLALHRLVASKVRDDPALLDRARTTLTRWADIVSKNSLPYVHEWNNILSEGLDATLAVATERSERADALRQSSPLSCLLTAEERAQFLQDWMVQHATLEP